MLRYETQDNPLIFEKVRAAYIESLKAESEEDEITDKSLWIEVISDVEEIRNPEELISYLIYDLHTDPEDACKEVYKVMATLIE